MPDYESQTGAYDPRAAQAVQTRPGGYGGGNGLSPTPRATVSGALAQLEQELAELAKVAHILTENLGPVLLPGNDRKDPGIGGGVRGTGPGIAEAVDMLTDRVRSVKATLATVIDRLAI